MSPAKNTARKTTGKHTSLTPGTSIKRARRSSPSASTSSIKNEKARHVSQAIGNGDPARMPIGFNPRLLSPSYSTQVSSAAPDTLVAAATSSTLTSGALIKQQSPNADHTRMLDEPVALCTRFATWLEGQKHVCEDALLRAVERDGTQFLHLAKAAVSFDNAVRGHVPAPAEVVLDNPLREHARTLRVFAEFLRSRVVEGTLNEEVQAAVLRDGEALFRLANCCLDFDQAIRGPENAS